jgi:internalin A
MARFILFLLIVVAAGCQKSAPTESSAPAKNPNQPGPRPPAEDGDQKGIKHAEKIGGKVNIKKSGEPGDPPIAVDLSGAKVTDADLKEFSGFLNLTRLNLSGTAVSGAGLKELATVYSLGNLDLSKCPNVDDAAMKELGKFQSLSHLKLSGTPVTDAGLKELTGLTPLDSLDVTGTKVTDAGVAELQKALPRCKIKK